MLAPCDVLVDRSLGVTPKRRAALDEDCRADLREPTDGESTTTVRK